MAVAISKDTSFLVSVQKFWSPYPINNLNISSSLQETISETMDEEFVKGPSKKYEKSKKGLTTNLNPPGHALTIEKPKLKFRTT